MTPFARRYLDLAGKRSPLCLGLDPSAGLIGHWGWADGPQAVGRFCDVVLEAAGDRLAVVKPQAAFFERFGPAGLTQMTRAVGRIRDQGGLSLVDAKRGDVLGTMEGYAQALAGADSGFGGDALTVNGYLGFDALRPVLDRAAAAGAGVFVVVRSSNPEGRALQNARREDGRTVAEAMADDITAYNAAVGPGIGPVGAVVGATIDAPGAAVLSRLAQSLVLAPGVGDQGASLDEVQARFGPVAARALPSVSRAILRHGPSIPALRAAIDRYRDQAWRALDMAPNP